MCYAFCVKSLKKCRGRTGFDVLLIVKSACRAFVGCSYYKQQKTNAELNTAVASFLGALFVAFTGLFAVLRRREEDYSSLSFVL